MSRVTRLQKLLIANRGEIARRVIRTAHAMGIATVAVYSDADRDALHAREAGSSFALGGLASADSYLRVDKLLEAARATGADAVHPGYGFLSENADFAQAVIDAGLTWVGPPPAAIRALGNKSAAKALAHAHGVPCLPGYSGDDQRDQTFIAEAQRIGFPLMVKAGAGGGGRGMRLVCEAAHLLPALLSARSEALSGFGNAELLIERALLAPRHVEVQVFADAHGHCIHLGERDCSVQRRHQKIIEEAPSPAVSPALRAGLGRCAVALAQAAGYVGAGTVEFLLEEGSGGASTGSARTGNDDVRSEPSSVRAEPPSVRAEPVEALTHTQALRQAQGERGVGTRSERGFYLMEMNTRLQVEHPVTEQTTGVDLVRAQIAVAAGERLPWSQDQLLPRGHAIEVRVYAEDPARGDLPQAGRLLLYREPSMPGVRVDAGITEGSDIPVQYDPLMAKLIAWGETREAARHRALEGLLHYPILGVRTNIPFLIALLEHPRFVSGQVDTGFVDDTRDDLLSELSGEPPSAARAVAAHAGEFLPCPEALSIAMPDPWMALRGWRG